MVLDKVVEVEKIYYLKEIFEGYVDVVIKKIIVFFLMEVVEWCDGKSNLILCVDVDDEKIERESEESEILF